MIAFRTESVMRLILVLRAEGRKSCEMEIKCVHSPDGAWYLWQQNPGRRHCTDKSGGHWNPAGPVTGLPISFSLPSELCLLFPISCFCSSFLLLSPLTLPQQHRNGHIPRITQLVNTRARIQPGLISQLLPFPQNASLCCKL